MNGRGDGSLGGCVWEEMDQGLMRCRGGCGTGQDSEH